MRRGPSARKKKPPPGKDVSEPIPIQKHPLADLSDDEARAAAAEETPRIMEEELQAAPGVVGAAPGARLPWRTTAAGDWTKPLSFASKTGAQLAKVRFTRGQRAAADADDRLVRVRARVRRTASNDFLPVRPKANLPLHSSAPADGR